MTHAAPRIRKPGARQVKDVRAARITQLLRAVKTEVDDSEASYVLGRAKHNWAEIKDFYVNYFGDIDLTTVADQFGVSRQQIYNRSGEEDWRMERVHVQAKLLRDRRAERNVDTARKAQEFDDRAYETAKLGMSLTTSRMAQIADQFTIQRIQFERALQRAAAGEAVSKAELWSSINYRELVELAKSLELFQHIGRRALGTDVQTIAMLMDGPDGSPLGERTASIAEELADPDPDRLAALVDALVDANLMHLHFNEDGSVAGLNIVDGEIVEEPEQLSIEGGTQLPADAGPAPAAGSDVNREGQPEAALRP